MSQAWEAAVEAAGAARLKVWQSLGETSTDVLAPLINPIFMGGPAWPTRPAWRTIRTPSSTILASEGLSDPWEDGRALGQGLEVLVEVPEVLADVKDSPLFAAVMELSHLLAANDILPLLDELGFVSTEVNGAQFPEALRNEHGRVGFVMGVTSKAFPATFSLPAGDARLVVATLLTKKELEAIVADGRNRKLVGSALSSRPGGHLSVLDRASVGLPAATKSAKAKSVKPKSAKPKPTKAKSAKAKSVKAKSVKAKSVKAKSAKAKSAKAKSAKAKSVKAKSAKRRTVTIGKSKRPPARRR